MRLILLLLVACNTSQALQPEPILLAQADPEDDTEIVIEETIIVEEIVIEETIIVEEIVIIEDEFIGPIFEEADPVKGSKSPPVNMPPPLQMIEDFAEEAAEAEHYVEEAKDSLQKLCEDIEYLKSLEIPDYEMQPCGKEKKRSNDPS